MSQSVEIYNEAYYAAGDKLEAVFHRAGVLRPDQLACIEYILKYGDNGKYTDRGIFSIGCGGGYLEHVLSYKGFLVTGVDPSEAAEELFTNPDKSIDKSNPYHSNFNLIFMRLGLKEFIEKPFDAKGHFIFCQSLEHIPEDDIKTAIPVLALNHSLIIIANTVNWHPIMPNNDDHITLVDDELFNWIASFGETLFRYKSHLVVQT